jgi:hypothetical protein
MEMHKMTRKAAIEAIRSAGASNDQRAFLRLYTENKISLATAKEEFSKGRQFAAFIERRDGILALAAKASGSDDAAAIELGDLIKETLTAA